MYKVEYVVRNTKGYAQDFSKLFNTLRDAIDYVRAVQNKYGNGPEMLIGKPSIEKI